MKISIKNLGIVDFAEIDLSKDLTLFCGPNGTGKTYVAYLLNALFNMKTEVPVTVDIEMKENLLLNGIIEIKRDNLRLWAEHIESQIKKQLPSIFGISPKEASNMFASTYIKLIVDDNDFDKLIKTELKFFLFHDLDSNPKIINIHKYPESTSIFVGKPDRELFDNSVKNILSEIYSYTFKYILLNNSARMLTVERNSIYTFKTELLANRLETVDNVLIFENEDAGEIVRKRATLYPQAVRNSLKIANELPEIIKKDSEYSKFASEIERQLLSGSVSIGKEGDVKFEPLSANHSSLPLPIQMSSSSVKTLSGLVVYLRHIAKKGDVLIIDEPEMNLHPDNQRRLARIFARMINNGLRLIISTHSDYIIRELNNLIMLNALFVREHEIETGYSKNEAIDKDRVQALLFNYNGIMGVTASTINVDSFGFEVTTIDSTIEDQNEQTMVLRDSLEELDQA